MTDLTTYMGLTKQRDRARVAGIEGDDLELNRNDQRGLLQVTVGLCNPVCLITELMYVGQLNRKEGDP